jgi:GH15 family glucan-1,4-alpha-glucosidase
MNHFPPIADYGFLSDCEASALVAPDGSIEWLCLPRPDAPSVFGALLDRSAGFFRMGPAHSKVPSQRRYVPGTMILETTWCTPTGWLVVQDALVMMPWSGGERGSHLRRTPGDFVAQSVLLRSAVCTEGHVELAVDCMPLFDYGRCAGTWEYLDEGYGSARCSCEGNPTLSLHSDIRLGLGASRAIARTELHKGESAFLALSWGDQPITENVAAFERLETTTQFWRGWLQRAVLPDHRWRPFLERSALTLKGLSYAPSGAILAAATTSLPETPQGERNWDYRFTWIRDSAFILRTLFQLGFDWEAFHYFAFLIDALGGGPLQVMYGMNAERDLAESTLDHLTGYGGARPVRIGNGAFDQSQHDVWGMVMDAVRTHMEHASLLGPVAWQIVSDIVECAISVWKEPDRGIWEVRGEPQHFTASKVMCWVALDRGVKLARDREDLTLAANWQKIADEIHADVCTHGVDDRGVFVQHYGGTALDASALLVVLMGFLPPQDERVRATVLAIAEELTEDDLVLRYRTEETDDGLSGEEGSFTICSFWLVSALAMIGEVDRATALCEKLLSFASPLHLYAEEIDPATGRHLGNFPQAFTHLALIEAVTRVIKASTA